MTMKKLTSLRDTLATLKSELAAVSGARPPHDEVVSALRGTLQGAVAGFSRAQANVAECIASGVPSSLNSLLKSSYERDEIALIAFGGALASYGMDRFIDEAIAMAGEPEGLRLSVKDREAKERDLLRKIYQLETEEEILAESLGVMRRSGVNAAAVLGIPLEIAEREGWLGGGA